MMVRAGSDPIVRSNPKKPKRPIETPTGIPHVRRMSNAVTDMIPIQ